MASERYLTLKEAAAQYGKSESTMSRLVRRIGVTTIVNPQDRRSRLVYGPDLESALSRSLPAGGSDELRAAWRSALDRARRGRRELESAGRTFLPIVDALALIRGEGEDDGLR